MAGLVHKRKGNYQTNCVKDFSKGRMKHTLPTPI